MATQVVHCTTLKEKKKSVHIVTDMSALDVLLHIPFSFRVFSLS